MTAKVPTGEDQQSPLRDLLIRISDPDLISLDADLVLQMELLNELSLPGKRLAGSLRNVLLILEERAALWCTFLTA